MGHVRFGFVAAAGFLTALAIGRSANAADQGITGKKLLLKSSPKMVLLSRDALVIPGANGGSADPRCVPDGSGLGGSVTLDDGTNSVTLNMPCANWTMNGSGTLYKYRDAVGTPRVGKVREGVLKIVSPGIGGFPVPNGAATVDVEVTVGTDKYCMKFSGSGDGSRFLVKNTNAGSCTQTVTFDFTGAEQTWVVPSGVTSVDVDVRGAQGADGDSLADVGGLGGRVQATLTVTPGETLYIYVGGRGGSDAPPNTAGTGGFNGGGAGAIDDADANSPSGGGGGASDVRAAAASP